MAPVGLTMGDPAGIGPELTAKIWTSQRAGLEPFLVIADPDLMAQYCPVQVITAPQDAAGCFHSALPIIAEPLGSSPKPGAPNPAHASAIIQSIQRAVALARQGALSAIVTNPINKAGLYANGFSFPGHTEFLGALTGVTRPVMMLAVEGLKVVPATIHQSIASVPSSLSINLLVETGLIVAEALRRDFGISAPRLVMTGLNPHAGESGSIGHEDHDIIEPAVEALRAAGVDIRGPLSADSLFHAKAREGYDAAICQYHDQALIPIKTIDFFGGVNVTLGLPIVRTSPDHGTGYDIAGQNVADPSSLLAAIRMAASIATHRAPLRAVEPRS